MQNIETHDDYKCAINLHRKIGQNTTGVFIFSVFSGFTGLSFIVFDLIEYREVNWIVFIFSSIMSLLSGMMFLLSFIETMSLERKIIEYSELKKIKLNLKSVKSSIVKAILFLCLLIFLAPFLAHAIKLIYNSNYL